MDIDSLQSELDKLREHAKNLLENMDKSDVDDGTNAYHLFRQFEEKIERWFACLHERTAESNARLTLERFLDVVPPDALIAEFDSFKERVMHCLKSQDTISGIAKPYAQFISMVEQPDLDLLPEDGDLIDDFFGRRVTRSLYQGKFSFSRKEGNGDMAVPKLGEMQGASEPVARMEPASGHAPKADMQQTNDSVMQQSALPEDNAMVFEISTQKASVPFGAKAFVNEYLRNKHNGHYSASTHPARIGELCLLFSFAWMGALTMRQLEGHLFTDGITAAHFERLVRSGYISIMRHLPSGMEFYAISEKGACIFKTKTTRDLVKRTQNTPLYALDCESERAAIAADAEAYESIASVALRIRDGKQMAFPDSFLERMHTEAIASLIYLRLSDEKAEAKSLAFIVMKPFDRIVIVPADDFPQIKQERDRYLEALIRTHDQAICFCTVSDDDAGIYCHTPSGESIAIDAFIDGLISASLAKETLPDDNATTQVGQSDNLQTAPEIAGEPLPASLGGDARIEDLRPPVSEPSWSDADAKQLCPLFDDIRCEGITYGNPFEMAKKMLEDGTDPSDCDSFNTLMVSLLNAPDDFSNACIDPLGRAVVLAKSMALVDENRYGGPYRRLLLAVDMPLDKLTYSSETLSSLFTGTHAGTAFHLAALLRALFLPESQYDFSLTDYAESLFARYDEVFWAYPMFKSTLDAFTQIGSVSREGFTATVVSWFVDDQTRNESIQKICADAANMLRLPHINQRFNGVLEMLELCFGPNSELGLCMDIISKNKVADRQFVLEVGAEWMDGGKPSSQRIDEFIDQSWKKVRQTAKKRVREDEFYSTARKKTIGAFHRRLEVISDWLAYADTPPKSRDAKLYAIRGKLTESLRCAVQSLREDASLCAKDRTLLSRAVTNLTARLEGGKPVSFLPEDWLSTGFFALHDGIPAVDDTFEHVRYYEAWRNALRHIAVQPEGLSGVLKRIVDPDDPLYDNYGQAVSICEYIRVDNAIYLSSMKNALDAAQNHIEEFHNKVGLDFAYGRVSEQTKETILDELEQHKPEFIERGDFANLRGFLSALRRSLDDEIAATQAHWEKAIDERRDGAGPSIFLERARQYLANDNTNLILVEEALNQFDSNTDAHLGDLDLSDEDLFSEFIDEGRYSRLEKVCRLNASFALRSFAPRYIEGRIDASERYLRSAQRLLESLPNEPRQNNDTRDMRVLLEEMGIIVRDIERDNPGELPALYSVKAEPERRNSESYKHPIAEMGTALEGTLCVMELFGKMEPRSILDKVRRAGARRMPLVFLNGYLTLAQRRQLAKLFFVDGNAQTPFVLVDWVLLMHLATKVPEERLRTLLACAMPYTGAMQLFAASSVTAVADEMYIGRVKEIRAISDMKGPVIVYGGRQLGKTALLIRAKNLFHAAKNDKFSAYVDIKECHDETSFVGTVLEALEKIGIQLSNVTSIKAMCGELSRWLQPIDRQLLLLLDESDNFLKALAGDRYAALNGLETLSRETGRFKFVFAGLHNVFLAAKDENTIFGHFGKPICIYPLSQSDAYKLLARPLRYLGFVTNPDRLLPLLVNTNFYPGVVHSLGAKLVDMLIYSYAKHYSETVNPPYQLEEQQIGSIMHSADLSNLIEERIRWTLEADPSYFMLARCIAILYYEEPQRRSLGYRLESIFACAKDLLEIDRLRSMTKEMCINLLSELCDMSILVQTEGRYRFRQTRFLSIVGKSTDDILGQIWYAQDGGLR